MGIIRRKIDKMKKHLRNIGRTRIIRIKGWNRDGDEVSAKVVGKIEK